MLPKRTFFLLLVAAFIAGGWVWWKSKRTPHTARAPAVASASEISAPGEGVVDWCAAGYQPIAGGCLTLASLAEAPQPLLIYLHGRYARDAATEEVDRQRRLGVAAATRGFAVLVLRGKLGQCSAAELSDWYCWPSNPQNEGTAAAVVRSWTGALEEARRRTHSRTRYVLGFSNGAYFAALLACRGLLDADAYVIAHGGPVDPVRAMRGTPPLLLLSADGDIAQDDMMRLDEELTRERWVHDSYARAGPHGLTDEDIDAALTFFTRAHEALPLDPPLPLHRPARHPHDRDAPVESQPAEDAPGTDQAPEPDQVDAAFAGTVPSETPLDDQ